MNLSPAQDTPAATQPVDAGQLLANASRASQMLRSLSHPARLVLLCRLAESEARVGELETMLGIPQAAVSKQLARLRDEGLVSARREGRSVIYRLNDERTRRVVEALYYEFCVRK